MSTPYPFESDAFEVSQPFGDFIVTSIPAYILLETAYSDRLKADKQPDGLYKLTGSQRDLVKPRLQIIGKFIDSPTVVFPNSIILAANYRAEDGLLEGEIQEDDEGESKTWKYDRQRQKLIIPTAARLAAIIDGQHRLFGFDFISKPERLNLPLLCVVYFDLPRPYQAFLFATVNSNQRPVSKSLTYELFGYNVEDEPPNKWTPEKLAVFLTRKLNFENDSPFYKHILIPAENDFSPSISDIRKEGSWAVSTGTVVEGILLQITNNPKKDAYDMHGGLVYRGGKRSEIPIESQGRVPPLRKLFLSLNDDLIYTGIRNFFAAAKTLFWDKASTGSYINKTVGVQALFDIARTALRDGAAGKDFSVSHFEKLLAPATNIDFSNSFFQTSGTGRQRIRTTIQVALKWVILEQLKESVRTVYQELTHSAARKLDHSAMEKNDINAIHEILASVRFPVGTLNMDYAANNVRLVERVQEILQRWDSVKDSDSDTCAKQRSELKLLGFAKGSDLTSLGEAALKAVNLSEIAQLWCAWIQESTPDDLASVNVKLLAAKRVFTQFWQLPPEIKAYFLTNVTKQNPDNKPMLQAIELICNAEQNLQNLSLEDVQLLASSLSDQKSLPPSVSNIILDHLNNKGARSWDSQDRLIVPNAWKAALLKTRK